MMRQFVGASGLAAALGAAAALFQLLACRAYLAIPEVPASEKRVGPLPISVIVPARNEEANLANLLPTLSRLEVEEIIVVDDESSDLTCVLATLFGARVIEVDSLPVGWAGKSHACALGAAAAHSQWLLFLDADVRPCPEAARNALAFAEENDAPVVSVLLHQRTITFWERLLIPFAYAQFLFGVALSPTAPLLNGQFVLARRDIYLAHGGHSAPGVRDAVAEDMALARHFLKEGVPIAVARHGAVGDVRMYRGFSDIRQGFSKNSAAFLKMAPRRGIVTMLGTIFATLWLPLILGQSRERKARITVMGLLLGQILGAAAWNRAFLGQPWLRSFRWAIWQPVAAVAFQAIGIESVFRSYVGGGLNWKGRRYSGIAAIRRGHGDR